jgi:acyl carrier protein
MTVARQDLLDKLRTVLRDLMLNDSLPVSESTQLAEIPEWDSMLHVTLVMTLEHQFEVRLNAQEAGSMTAVKPILDLLETKLSHRST